MRVLRFGLLLRGLRLCVRSFILCGVGGLRAVACGAFFTVHIVLRVLRFLACGIGFTAACFGFLLRFLRGRFRSLALLFGVAALSVFSGFSCRFASALGELEGLEVDNELLFAAALLHDAGLVGAAGEDDFTLASARVARDVADQVGLSTASTETLQTAITMHYSPLVPLAAGPVAYLLAAGAGVDAVGMRSWDLPPGLMADAVRDHPREGFKAYFSRAWAGEAARVPQGRAKLLRRYGAFTVAIALAPFDE